MSLPTVSEIQSADPSQTRELIERVWLELNPEPERREGVDRRSWVIERNEFFAMLNCGASNARRGLARSRLERAPADAVGMRADAGLPR